MRDQSVGVIGAGLTGLMVGEALLQAGYFVRVFSDGRIRTSQSAHCQGFLHSGLKYPDLLADAPLAMRLADGSAAWRYYLSRCRSQFQSTNVNYLFSEQDAAAAFVRRARSMNVDVLSLTKSERSHLGNLTGFDGWVVEADEIAINTDQLIKHLEATLPIVESRTGWTPRRQDRMFLVVSDDCETCVVDHVVICAGRETQVLAAAAGIKDVTLKSRPLMTFEFSGPRARVAAHVFGPSGGPELTLSAWHESDNASTWRVGGAVAEHVCECQEGANRLYAYVQAILPDMAKYVRTVCSASLCRAEPADGTNSVAQQGLLASLDKAIACVPTKMTLIPLYVRDILQTLELQR